MDKKLVFVLSGGGSHGALQVGALYALLESGFQPDLLVGTSIGAVNSALLALNHFSKNSLDLLAAAWREAVLLDLLPSNYISITFRAMFRHSSLDPAQRIHDFLVSHGLTPEITFSDIQEPALIIVSSDLNSGQPVLHGTLPDEKVLDALLLSTALPPWVMPVKKENRYIMDGSVVSNLPVEPALKMGATEIIALDLLDTRPTPGFGDGMMGFFDKLYLAVEKRQTDLELELVEARGIPTLYLALTSVAPVPFWNFHNTDELISTGYEIARSAIKTQPQFSP